MTVTVDALIKYLQQFDGSLRVIAGSDDEGNDYVDVYEPSLSWCIDDPNYRAGLCPVHPDDVGTEYDEDELVQAVVL